MSNTADKKKIITEYLSDLENKVLELCENATPGDVGWYVGEAEDGLIPVYFDGEYSVEAVGEFNRKEDAEFAAQAHTALPEALRSLAELRRVMKLAVESAPHSPRCGSFTWRFQNMPSTFEFSEKHPDCNAAGCGQCARCKWIIAARESKSPNRAVPDPCNCWKSKLISGCEENNVVP